MAGLKGERALVEGTPDYMLQPLRDWVDKAVNFQHFDLAKRLQLRLRRTDVVMTPQRPGPFILLDGEKLLEVIDAALAICSPFLDVLEATVEKEWWSGMLRDLAVMLKEGGSAWKLNADLSGLTRRVDETVAQAAKSTMKAAPPDASAHLRRAWEAAYGFSPDATKAYSEAVKAVEAVVLPATIPNDRVGTLGKALKHIKQTAAKWTVAVDQSGTLASADALIAMLALMWRGQSDRHAGPNTSPVTLESAQTALHLAVTLVQWFNSGAVKKAP